MVLVNIGCGSTWHPAWINLDVRPSHGQVKRWDALLGLPFADAEVDACYSSHFLEHLSRTQARALMVEAGRVLKPGGIIRLAVPDLEAMTKEYLSLLTQAASGDETAARRYEWITLEMLDQLVRTESGGEMERYLRSQAGGNADYVLSRIGPGAKEYLCQSKTVDNPRPSDDRNVAGPPHAGLQRALCAAVAPLKRIFQRTGHSFQDVAAQWCGALAGARGRQAMQEGLFRQSGEIHRWMYDRFSLRRLLEQAGFQQIHTRTAFESRIPAFATFGLDVLDGRVRKPDSLFMEAVRS
ncbi:SAM-dependent methyltransferase, type 11 [Nitrospira japonica]|uniref:SAM-dependent methyltransferase, type 11 n=1 Tax=Nitrospira japonica TaxID=1325564 RepID=A0A1W1I0J9_9BACT|nr:methyltransferase domain-containing protein [Nitrospira japonica]SLM46409.1 SAM-dependent methyltransferase, type 11 [Nitrospira japonica]